jgi:probable HAF family extracellular repeat protein
MTILHRIMIAVVPVVLLATTAAWAVPNYIATPLVLGGIYSEATAINANGQVTGCLGRDNDLPRRAFLYSGGVMLDLGTLGGTNSCGRSINSKGQVAGTSDVAGDSAQHAFLYSGGSLQDLGTLGGNSSNAVAINANGQVTGTSDIAGNAAKHTFLYSGGAMRDLGMPNSAGSAPAAINASGQVVGRFESSSLWFEAFFYTGSSMLDLGTLGGQSSGATDINDAGQVVGSSWTTPDATGHVLNHMFLYSEGVMRDVGSLVGPQGSSYGGKINASGQVIGWSDPPSHAFIYSGGVMTDLGALGDWASYPYDINAVGQVVGRSYVKFENYPNERAFIFTGGAMYNLNDLVVAGLDGAILTDAIGINDSGQIIANACIGYCKAFRLDPVPGPAVILPIIEFYHASLDHYFMTSMPNEIAMLDAGTQIKGWTRTGHAFKAHTTPQAGTLPACRYYIPPGYGDSHFFSAAPDECAIALIKFPWFFKETDAAFYIALPNTTTGVCANNEIPVYRLWNGRAASNHRYTTSTVVKSSMIARGYIAEGYGPDQVDMCAPQ